MPQTTPIYTLINHYLTYLTTRICYKQMPMKKVSHIHRMRGHIDCGLCSAANLTIDRVEPPYWWTGMQQDTLQIMVHGKDIANSIVSVDYPDVRLAEQVRLESPNYLLLYLAIGKEAKPGTMDLKFMDGKKSKTLPYELKARTKAPEDYKGFDSSDVLYLIMPDRFASDGRKEDKAVKDLDYPSTADRSDPTPATEAISAACSNTSVTSTL